MSGELLRISELSVHYRPRRGEVHEALRSVSLTVRAGETVAIVGESGSGKSTTARTVLGLLPASARVTAGRVDFDGQSLVGLGERRWRALRGRQIALIPQDPGTALNPVQRVGHQVAEALTVHGLAGRREALREAVRLLDEAGVGQAAARALQYPHELSGGLRQRVLIAIAMAARPRLVVADEPTSALDVTLQRRVLDHLADLTRATGAAILLITHDLAVAADRADRVVVMSQGHVVEEGPPARVLGRAQHPYTRALIAAAPGLTARARRAPRRSTDEPAHVRVDGLVKEFPLPARQGSADTLRAVAGVSFAIRRGETFALVGESGSGKSTVARLMLRLVDPTGGRITFGGEDITDLTGHALRRLRRRMQLVHQNPYASLNPRLTVAQIVRAILTRSSSRSFPSRASAPAASDPGNCWRSPTCHRRTSSRSSAAA